MSLPKGEIEKPKKPKPNQVEIYDVELLAKDDRESTTNFALTCPHTYRGIGVKRAWGGRITSVAPGWPADRAGIKEGDIMEPWDINEENGYMEFTITRNGKTVKMILRTEDICFR